MVDVSFLNRMRNADLYALILALDTAAAIFVFTLIGFYTDWNISKEITSQMIDVFIRILAITIPLLFLILVLFLSFFERDFIVWFDEYNNFACFITTIQYNIYLQFFTLILLLLIRFTYYIPLVAIIAIALFTYVLVAMFSFVKHSGEYAIARYYYLTHDYEF